MIKTKKIAAFTMVDILTGMVITSIIISMVFHLFTALNKQIAEYGQIRSEINSYLLLKTDLKRQFEGRNRNAIGIPGGLQLDDYNEIVTYKKEDQLFVRKVDENFDTLSRNLIDLRLEFISLKSGLLSDQVKTMNLKVAIEKQTLELQLFHSSSLVDEINQTLIHVF